MKLRTSFFNPTVLKKDLTRFAPLWSLYTVFMLLFLLLIGADDAPEAPAMLMNNASAIMGGMSLVNLVYCGLAAFLLFGDLSNARLCNALHAMPMRREGWFLTHLCAGFLMCMVPNTLGALIAAGMLQQYCYGAFIWLAVMLLQFLFFFGVGVFCTVCAGNRLGAVVMYALVNFLSVLAAWLVMTFYQPVLYGIELDLEDWAAHSPAVGLAGKEYISTAYDNMRSTTEFKGFVTADWRYLGIAAAVGAALLVLALLIYRKRHLETAGDFISAKPAAPIFLVLYTLCFGAMLMTVGGITGGTSGYIFLAAGLIIGFFTGKMLLERKVNVVQKKTFLSFALLVVAFAASVGLTWLDPTGITRYVPDGEQVESVTISPFDNWYYVSSTRELTDPADIAAVTQLHAQLVENREAPGSDKDRMVVSLRYELKNGTTVTRRYEISARSQATQLLRSVGSRPEMVLGTADMQQLLKNLCTVEFYPVVDSLPEIHMFINANWMDTEQDRPGVVRYAFDGSFLGQSEAESLVRALEADCEAGDMAQSWVLHQGVGQVGTIALQVFRPDGGLEYRDIVVYATSENTIACLKELAK